MREGPDRHRNGLFIVIAVGFFSAIADPPLRPIAARGRNSTGYDTLQVTLGPGYVKAARS
jgi:hypothetical protein